MNERLDEIIEISQAKRDETEALQERINELQVQLPFKFSAAEAGLIERMKEYETFFKGIVGDPKTCDALAELSRRGVPISFNFSFDEIRIDYDGELSIPTQATPKEIREFLGLK